LRPPVFLEDEVDLADPLTGEGVTDRCRLLFAGAAVPATAASVDDGVLHGVLLKDERGSTTGPTRSCPTEPNNGNHSVGDEVAERAGTPSSMESKETFDITEHRRSLVVWK